MLRIESRYLGGSQSCQLVRSVDVGKRAVPEGVHRNRALLQVGKGVTPPVVGKKEKELVLDNGAADAAAKLVADERRPRHAGVVVEPIVRFQAGVAMVFHQRAVEGVGAALRHEFVLASATAGGIG